jgi:predicted regulator of Ras-like GTPase activity (Roadblock/LC7/MglB family)
MMRAIPDELKAHFEKCIGELHARVPSIMGCVIATVDGRLVSSIVDNEADPKRLSAMAGSMVALGETIGREVQIGRSQSVVVSALNGLLLLQRVPSKRDLLVVGTLARTNASLGTVLHETRSTAKAVADVLDQWLDNFSVAV